MPARTCAASRDGFEHRAACGRQLAADESIDLLMKRLDLRIRMRPAIRECARIESPRQRGNLGKRQHPGALRDEQPNGQLNRRHMIDEIEIGERVQEIAVALERRPGMERHERRGEGHRFASAQGDHVEEILARVPFVEEAEDAIVERFDRARDEQTARVAQHRQQRSMLQQMLDLYRHVVGDVGMRPMERLDEREPRASGR